MRTSFATIVGVMLFASGAASQSPGTATGLTLELIGPAGQERVLSVSELRALTSKEADVSAHNVHGHYRGVPLGDLLRLVGRPAGDSLRGAALAQDIIVEGADGYRVVFAPAELDGGFTDKVVLLAYEKDGAALDSTEGPFRLIAVGEKRPARWVRGVVRVRMRPVAP